ncbi:MAG: hypothetical protein MHM6MM_008102 [Cercozoa sp. M6MM]
MNQRRWFEGPADDVLSSAKSQASPKKRDIVGEWVASTNALVGEYKVPILTVSSIYLLVEQRVVSSVAKVEKRVERSMTENDAKMQNLERNIEKTWKQSIEKNEKYRAQFQEDLKESVENNEKSRAQFQRS